MLARIQAHLEAIYALEPAHGARAHLVGPAFRARLTQEQSPDEALLVVEDDDSIEVGLFYSDALLEWLGRHGEALHGALRDDLNRYCQVAEGISHFLYLHHTVSTEAEVSLLELEAQAEVDKFATCALLEWACGTPGDARGLWQKLFSKVRWREGHSEGERDRYVRASQLAASFCGRLLPLVSERRLERFLAELRYAYRLAQHRKLRHLMSGERLR